MFVSGGVWKHGSSWNGNTWQERSSWQWQPDLDSHDPSPPITLENAAASEFSGTLVLSITPTLNLDGDIGVQGALAATQAAPTLNLDGDIGVDGALAATQPALALNLDGEHGVSGALALSLSPVLDLDGTFTAQIVVSVGPAKRWWETLQPRERERERRRERRLKLKPIEPVQGTLQLELRPELSLGLVTLHEAALTLQMGAPTLRMVGEVLQASEFDAYTRQRREDEELLWIWAA